MNDKFQNMIEQIGKVVLGKQKQIKLALTCLFAGGHLLIEDRPGIGKTTLAKILSRCLGMDFRRIQCTSDMLPGDILGVSVFERKTGRFVFHAGPIFTQVLLADEINRATPKTQSALLEAMEERQVTVEGKTRRLEKPFFIIATQNPMEQFGTFSLPESQLDRFLMRINLGYPDRSAERQLLKQGEMKSTLFNTEPCLTHEEVLSIQKQVIKIHASDALLEYVQDILTFTRNAPHFSTGLSPRAGLSFLRAAKSHAFLHGRDHVLPEDLQEVMLWVVAHRLRPHDDRAELSRDRLKELLMEVPIP